MLWHDRCVILFAHIVLRLVTDLVSLAIFFFRSRLSVEAENLLLRRQLGLYRERGVKPQTRRCRCAGVTCVHLPTLRLALCSGNCAARDDDSVALRRMAASVALEITAGTTTHSARTAQTHSAHGDRESDLG